MSAGWIVLGMGIALVLVISWLRRGHDVDLGSVSHRWIAEHRMSQGHDSQR